MKAAILEEGKTYFTDLLDVFEGVNNIQCNYKWLITGYECYPTSKKNEEIFSSEYVIIDGQELTELLKLDNFQWIWGVFSAFDKNIKNEKILDFELPYANENEKLWESVSLQHPLAEIEIVAWDSSKTLIFSRNDAVVDLFKNKFHLAKQL
jgi:hypothetical protein